MIELKNVRKIYTTKVGQTAALDGVSLTFPDKGLVFIVGKSGSGKTTMLNVIGGLDGFDEGEIIIDGKSFKDLSAKDYDNYRNTFIGVVFQEYNLLPEYTVEKNIKIATELQGVDVDDAKVDSLLEQVEILEYKKRLPRQLSGGQMQRVAIARALIKDPHIILADEPTGALDSNTGIQVIETLKKLSENKLVIIVSHDLELAEKYADRIISLKDGLVVSDVTATEVEVAGGVYDGEVFYVKSGAKLTKDEGEKLINAVAESRKIEVTETLKIREKRDTGVIDKKLSERSGRALISSKMKFKSTAWLGFKSLTVKPIRLIITILLAVIAFGLFGVFDAVASYDRQKIIFYNLKDSGFNGIVSSAKYVNSYGDTLSLKTNDTAIEKLNRETGYSYKGVHYLVDRSDTTNNVAGKHNISQISAYSTTIKQSYYYKFLNGQLEFDSTKLTNIENDDGTITSYITEGGFNFKILHGTYPNAHNADGSINPERINDIGISSYIADSIIQHCGQNLYGGVAKLNSVADLVGQKIKIDTGYEYTITCIIDCGYIPERYIPLKTTSDDPSLANEFLSFLYSGAYLNIFTDVGHFEYRRALNNTIQTYYMPLGNTTINVQELENKFSDSKNEWYCIDDIPETNILTFQESVTTAEDGTKIKGNVEIGEREVLIDITKITALFAPEYERIAELSIAKKLNSNVAIIKDKAKTFEEKRAALTEFISTMEQYILPSHVSGSLLGQTITHKFAKVDQFFDYSKTQLSNNVKIVGVYFGINQDITPANWILAVNQTDMQHFGIYSEQGTYARMISPVEFATSSRAALAEKMCNTSGIIIDWYNNTVITSLEKSQQSIEVFFNLFIYVDMLVASFAIFMLTNYISTSIIQKRQTIGILRALGSGGKDIFMIFIIESMIIAILNGVFAGVFGFVGCQLVNFYIREFMSINVSFAIFEMRQASIIFFSSVITAILASLIPIIRICKRKPVELIRKSY